MEIYMGKAKDRVLLFDRRDMLPEYDIGPENAMEFERGPGVEKLDSS